MHWAKRSEAIPWNLSGSGAPSPPWTEEPGLLVFDRDPLSSVGDLHGFPALREAIAAAHGVLADSVLVADGTSLANYAALSVLAAPGERVLVETPTYRALAGIPRFHGAEVFDIYSHMDEVGTEGVPDQYGRVQ